MTELEIAGLGLWSPHFSNWKEFSDGINTGNWQSETSLQPDLIPTRERRRAPLSVKLAVVVMSQACEMACLDPVNAAVVFSSAMGDMQIKDYLCRTLSTPPRLVSPTRFHNSVHNATTGYWSIASHSHGPSNAISAYAYTAPMAFLEAAIQTLEDSVPVLLVTQEMAAPLALHDTCPSDQPFSSAILLTPKGFCVNPVASIQFSVTKESVNWPDLPEDLNQDLGSNFGARLVPLIAAIAANGFTKSILPVTLDFPRTSNSCLKLSALFKKAPDRENE
jgi:hypothetical protein